MADEQDALVLAIETPLYLWNEGGEETFGAVVALLDILAFARRVPDGAPAGIDLAEVSLKDVG